MISAPNGLIINLYGPFCGRNNDRGTLAAWDLDTWRNVTLAHKLYGDRIYVHGDCISRAPRNPATPMRRAELKAYNACRVTIEQVFGNITKLWKVCKKKDGFKLFTSSSRGGLGAIYKLAVLLSNCHACLNGAGPVASFFTEPCIDLETYLGM